MIGKLRKLSALPLALLLCTALPVLAQKNSIAISALGSLPTSTSSSTVRQNPSSGTGFLIEWSHIRNPLVGYNISYSLRRANQQYTAPNNATETVQAWAHTFTVNWLVSMPLGPVRAFALAGGGVDGFNPPNAYEAPTRNQTRGVFDYGIGVDWPLLPHIGLRFQYRGLLYKAPRLADAFDSSGSLVHDAQPIAGFYFRF